jgi:deoxyribonuclease (pyrimidine dimer)
MTRINLVPPEELMDQHLFAEWREIKMVPKSLARSLRAHGRAGVLLMVPRHYTLNTGHVSFFYNKGGYLRRRYADIKKELQSRGLNFDSTAKLDQEGIYAGLPATFQEDYEPTPEALAVVRERIALRISQRPGWYRYRGNVQDTGGK